MLKPSFFTERARLYRLCHAYGLICWEIGGSSEYIEVGLNPLDGPFLQVNKKLLRSDSDWENLENSVVKISMETGAWTM